ncbi:hypothetical protein LLH23_18525 [bacterium]|nr:hypothetical protein [bacterium]
MRRELALFGAALLALTVVLAGCSGGSSPALPSPDGGADQARSTVTTDSGGDLLPDGLGVSNFAVTINGTGTTVLDAIPASDAGISICFVVDSTGSMGGEIDGVVDSIAAFAASFAGVSVTWSGIEFGDATPSDGPNTWDFFGDLGERTLVQVASGITALQEWLAPISANGGGDAPENPLKALMEARSTMRWPAGAARHFIVLTDVGAHQRSDGPTDPADEGRPDGAPFCPYEGSEVLATLKSWPGVVHAVSPDYTSYWADAEAAQAAPANSPSVKPQAVAGWAGWDIRELADGGPAAYRTHNGTGGKWAELPTSGSVDLTTLGIDEYIKQAYTVVYRIPEGTTSGHVVITATYLDGGVSKTSTFDLGTVSFD